MPRKRKRQAAIVQKAKKEVKMLTSRLLEITVIMDEYIYYKKSIRSCEAKCYLQELNNYEERFTMDVRSQQVVEKLVNFMKRIIEEEAEELRANETLGNFETATLPAQTSFSFTGNRLSSPFDLNRLDGPNGYEGNMNRNEDLDINANEKTFNHLNESQRIQIGDSSQINNDEVTLLSQSVLKDHNYTSWEGPKPYHEPNHEDTTRKTKRNAIVAEPRKPSSLLRASQRNNSFMAMPFQSPSVARKIVLVKIPGENRTKTPSSAKYIKITATPRRNLNIPPIYIRTPPNERTKKVLFSNSSGLPANDSQKNEIAQLAPKKAPVPITIAPETNVNEVNKKQIKRRTSKVQSDDEKVIKRPKRRGKRNSSQETNVSVDKANCGKKKRGKNKLKPNEEDLSWVENLNFVRVIEKDEICAPNMNVTDSFWQNLDYPPDWDDGVYLM